MISFILSNLKTFKIGAVVVVIAAVLILISCQREKINDLSNTVERQQTQIATLNKTIESYQAKVELSDSQSAAINDKLSDCYLQITRMTESMNEIDEIMKLEEEEDTPTQVAPVKDAPKINKTQSKAGLDFVNKQIQRLGENK
jgi:predicted RNase H-like nuclease (RuvC/YqgF family)